MLSPKKMKVLETLVTCGTKKETIAKCGISPETLNKYLRDPEFASVYQELRIEGLKENYRFVQANVREAVERLIEMVNADVGDISDSVRLNAINSLLQYSFRITEQMDIIDRINELEKKVKENG